AGAGAPPLPVAETLTLCSRRGFVFADEGYRQFRQALEQDPQALHPLRPPQLPPPEEHLLLVRLPRRPHPQV
uniref:Uncharacterized protein n=1 Tax=Aegilops tauschii subsp. strangulata TaxID=200361 RepID=A0A452ZEI0_AEGTS